MNNRSFPLRRPAALLAACLTAALGGCSYAEDEVGTPGFADRCADFMERSFPGGDVTIKAKHEEIARTSGGGLSSIIATVAGERKNVPEGGGFLAHRVAAECHFQNGILIEFKWTEGPFR